MTVVFFLHSPILQTELAHQLHAPNFKPDGEVRVIHHAHVVGFRVADAQPGLARRHYFVVHLGLRLSRKLVTPSLKSAVWRMAAFSWMARASCRSSWSLVKLESKALVTFNEAGLISISSRASWWARVMSWSGATTSLTKPI